MTYALIRTKLYLDGKKIVTSNILRNYCKKLNISYNDTIRYLIRYKYLYRIFRGIFYVPNIEERKFKRLEINYLDAIVEALKIKGVKNWYFGLNTALKLNAITHEFYTLDYVINDTIFRAKPITILGHKIKFIKLKKELFSFGITKNKINFSDMEKTVLDIVYLSFYDGLNDNEVKIKIADIMKKCSKSKILKYASHYNKNTYKFVEDTL